MNEAPFGSSEIAVLLNDFLLNDDIAGLAADVGRLLGYPLLVINDTFHVAASYYPAEVVYICECLKYSTRL